MSLIKKPELTPEKLAANQENAQLSRGPVTPEGLQRAREARVVHGYYSSSGQEALQTLGEDPQEFSKFYQSMIITWEPQSSFEYRLVHALARALWRVQRGDRIQEAATVMRLKKMDSEADQRARRQSALYEAKRAGLDSLLEACGRTEFVTTQAEIDTLASAYRGQSRAKAREILTLLLHLAPGQGPRPELPAGEGLALRGKNEPAVAEGPKREEVRGRLQALLRAEIEALEERQAEHDAELLETTTPYYRDTLLASEDRLAGLMTRMEEVSLHRVERLTRLLIQVQEARDSRRERKMRPVKATSEGWSHDVIENKGRDKFRSCYLAHFAREAVRGTRTPAAAKRSESSASHNGEPPARRDAGESGNLRANIGQA